MRGSMAYFAGAGTVIVAIAAGLGGGLVIADIVSPSTRELGKVELRTRAQASPQSSVAQSQPTEPQQQQAQPQQKDQAASDAPRASVPYLAQTEQATVAPVVTAAPQDPPHPQHEQQSRHEQQPQSERHEQQPQSDQQPQRATANSGSQSAAAATGSDQPAKLDNAYAKAREADLKRSDEKRKSDRRQQWTSRRHQPSEQESRDVDEQVRGNSGPREVIVRRDDVRRDDYDRPNFVRRDDYDRPDFDRPDSDRPMRFGFPGINLFGPD
jgi:type IV secretory pathway VirB10-like protein